MGGRNLLPVLFSGLQQLIDAMFNMFTILGNPKPQKMSPCLGTVQATGSLDVPWAQPARSGERMCETISDTPERAFSGLVFH